MRKLLLPLLLCVFAVLQTVTGQVFNLGNTGTDQAWYKLGSLTLPQQGHNVSIHISSGIGYNAGLHQNGEAFILFRTSNGSSENSGFFGAGSFFNAGRSKILQEVKVIQISQFQWDFYALLSWYTGEGSTLSVTSLTGVWTRDFILSEPPLSQYPYYVLKEELVNLSPTFFFENVGIGTDNPQEKLSVNGKIRAKEIKVETANWPDYVFEKSYQLPDLQQTKSFIKANGHLPGIPSAKQVEKDGVSLGEMNALLLKKVEELTLHILELDERVKIQAKEIEQQGQMLIKR